MFVDLLGAVIDYHGDLIRNIKGIRVAQDLFDDLSVDEADRAVAVVAEAADRIPSAAPLVTRPFDYGTVITYPFVPQNWHVTRFSDGLHFGVWYGSLELETTVYETVYHWHRFVMDAFASEDRSIRSDRHVFDVRCDAILIDLRGNTRQHRQLLHRKNYSFGQKLGHYLKEQGQNGVLVTSARCEGVNAAMLRPDILSNPRHRCYLSYAMNPRVDQVVVERAPGRRWLAIRPSSL